jgi:hypothetical protein
MGNDLKVVLTMVDNMSEKLTGVETKLGAFGKTIDNTIKMWTGFGAALGGILAVGQIEAFVKKGIEYGDAVEKMSRQTGLQTDETQKLDYILKQSGSSLEAMTRPLINLSKEAYNGNVAFKVLGISIKDGNGNLKDSGTLFEEAITKLGGISNTTERAAIAQKLFGKGTKDVLSLVAEGTDNIKRYSDETEKYGLILDDKMIRELDEAKKAGVLFDQAMKVAAANLAVAFAPALIEIAHLAAETAKALRDMFGAVNNKDVAYDLAKDQVQALQQEEIQLKKNIELAGKNQNATVVWMRSNGEMGHDKLRVAQAELVALQSQLKMNEALVKQNAPKSRPTQFNADDFKGGETEAQKEARAIEEWQREYARRESETKKHNDAALKEDLKLASEKTKILDDEAREEMRVHAEQRKIREELKNELVDSYTQEVNATNDKYDKMLAAGANNELVETARQKRLKELKINASGSYAIQAIGDLETIAKASKADAQVQKDLAYGMAIVNTALGVTKTLSAYPMPYAAILAALDVAAGAAEIATISGQQFAVGTPYAGGGMAMVGERGPERVMLPRGSQVQTAGQTAATGGGSGGEVHIHIHDANGNVLEAATQQLRSRSTADRFVSMVFSHANKMGIN